MELLKPPSLIKGDTIAIIAPSSGLAKSFPHRVEAGVLALQDLGFSVKLFLTTSLSSRGSAGTPCQRADDIHLAFEDPTVSAIIATIGGLTLNEVIPLIDYRRIRANPKIFCGYSDNTLLNCALLKHAGLVSFYGPILLTQFAEFPQPFSYTVHSFLKAVTSSDPIGQITPAEHWTEEFLDWEGKLDLTRPRKTSRNLLGHCWLREGSAVGTSLVGCLPSLLSLNGTSFAPEYEGRILCIESPEGQAYGRGYPLQYIYSELVTMRLADIFERIAGLVVGRPYNNNLPHQRKEFFDILLRATEGYNFPILANVDFGHTDPIATLPLGVTARMDSHADLFSFDESGVESRAGQLL